LPNAIIEAMACGTPVVSTDTPSGPSELIQNNLTGKLVPMGDASLMAAAILQILSDQERAAEMANRAQENIQKGLSLDKIGRHYEEVLFNCSLRSHFAKKDQH
jgi:glycosyltransferase involved in cell wall biosynthesis